MNYVGDIDPSPSIFGPSFGYTRYNIGVELVRRQSPHWSYRAALSYGRMGGSDHMNASYNDHDIYRRARNLSFRNQIVELKADVVFDIFGNRAHYRKRHDYTPYLFMGIAYFHHSPQAKTPDSFGGHWIDLRPLKTEGNVYSLNQVAIPVGMGFRYKVGKRWDLAFEMGWRFTLTDYLDDVSGTYVDRGTFGDNPLAVAMADRSMEALPNDPALEDWVNTSQGYNTSDGYTTVNGYGREGNQRGDKTHKDVYIVSGFHLTYILDKGVKCPPKF